MYTSRSASHGMKKTLIILAVIIVVAVGAYLLIRQPSGNLAVPDTTQSPAVPQETASPAPSPEGQTVIGTSVENRPITAYHFGTGDTRILFVGGIHGGYSWNTSLLAHQAIEYFQKNPAVIPENTRVTVIPVLNPDGLSKVASTTGLFSAADITASEAAQVSGRFNARNVDLNRNFDCDWQASGVWQNKTVSGGSEAFSEPEALAMKQYVESQNPSAVVVWYSAAGGVFASSCHNGILPKTSELTNAYAQASGYPAYESFNFYEITGDMVNWLAKKNIPAISVLLSNHTDTDWTKNRKGIDAVLKAYAN
jgi:hypothetical protein